MLLLKEMVLMVMVLLLPPPFLFSYFFLRSLEKKEICLGSGLLLLLLLRPRKKRRKIGGGLVGYLTATAPRSRRHFARAARIDKIIQSSSTFSPSGILEITLSLIMKVSEGRDDDVV